MEITNEKIEQIRDQGRIVKAKHREMEAAEKLKQALKPFDPSYQPTDLVDYPGVGKLSRFGTDRGAKRRPMRQTRVLEEGRLNTANRVTDSLDRMRGNGTIGDHEYEAARIFQEKFRRLNHGSIKSVNLSDAGGGGMTLEEFYSRAKRERDYCYHVFDLLGGDGSQMSKAVYWVIGLEKSIIDLSRIDDDSPNAKHYWRGVLVSALQIMAHDQKKKMAQMRRRCRSRGYS